MPKEDLFSRTEDQYLDYFGILYEDTLDSRSKTLKQKTITIKDCLYTIRGNALLERILVKM